MAKTKTEPRTAEMAPTDIQRPSRARTERRSAELQQVLRSLDVLLDRQAFMQMAGLQFDGRRDLYQIFGYDRIITAHQYREVYLRGGVAKQIVEAFPKATWRGGVEVYEDEDASVSTPFEQAFEVLEKKHHIFNTLLSADILAGLSTYSVILIGAPGNLQEELPKGNPDSLLYLAPFWGGGGPGDQSRSTSMRTQASDTDVTIESFEVDPSQPRFGEPLTYRIRRTDISSPMLAREVHWSRVVHICEGALDSSVYGTPTLESIWNLLMDLEKVTGGGSESYFQRAKHALHLNIDKDTAFSPDDLTALKTKLDEFQHNITTALPTRGVDVKMLEAAVANFSPAVDSIIKQIAGSKGIPQRILTGSEMGTLASEQDAANFDSRVQDRRTGYAGPMIARRLIDRLIDYGYLPTPKQYDIGWPVEENMDEAGRAAFAEQLAKVNQTFGALVFTQDEIREKAFDLEPLPEMTSSEQLSEPEKAVLADKLTLANKQQGVTVFTDDEIRKIAYDFEPLPEGEKVAIGAPERITVTAPPPIGEEGTPMPQAQEGQPKPVAKPAVPAPTLQAAELHTLLRDLETAIEQKDLAAVGRLLELDDSMNVEKALAYLGHGIPVMLRPDSPLVVWVNNRAAAGALVHDTYESLKAAWDAEQDKGINPSG
jgi:hypothetical protein